MTDASEGWWLRPGVVIVVFVDSSEEFITYLSNPMLIVHCLPSACLIPMCRKYSGVVGSSLSTITFRKRRMSSSSVA